MCSQYRVRKWGSYGINYITWVSQNKTKPKAYYQVTISWFELEIP